MNKDNFKDYYKILQVDRNATQEVITMDYKSLAKKYHPDLNLNNLNEANEKMKDINEAYNILNNAESRTKYNLVYDSHMKNTINNSNIDSSNNNNNNSSNNTYNSYMTEKSREEDTKKGNIKISNLFKLNKRNIVIASIIAILFICVTAEKNLISNDYDSIAKIHRDISTNIVQTDKMKADVDSNHVNYSDNHSGNPVKKVDSHHNAQINDTSNQEEIYLKEVRQLEYLTEEVQAPSALIHRLLN
jgi:curved DNA-binding protein CbpA